jgi:CubicO group peptidase (beta-lactamase class C family)
MKIMAFCLCIALCAASAQAQGDEPAAAIDAYVKPYVQTGNFSGNVLVQENGKTVFANSYGFSDRERRVSNSATTQFHIASMSMQFTAAAILRLADMGSVRLDEHIGDFVPGIEGADTITVRDLLTERSGLPDINAFPDYNDVLQHHQTPARLIAKIEGHPLLFVPGSKFLREEHSAYNFLALIVEKQTGLPFAAAVKRLVFMPMGLTASGVDDDSVRGFPGRAKGYEPEGTYGMKAATAIHWSAKAGNASVFTTTGDEARWVNLLFQGHLLSSSSRDAILDTSLRVGYGWFKAPSERFGETAYYMNGRSPGFNSFVLYLPHSQTTIVVFSNIYSSATTTIGYDVAAIARGLPYEAFRPADSASISAELEHSTGTFQFGPDFYQANAKVNLVAKGSELLMEWPSGDVSALIPLRKDRFVDRSYWEEVKVERDSSGSPDTLVYDRFRGKLVQSH